MTWVAFDVTGVSGKPTGVGRYALGLLDGLLSLEDRNFGLVVEATSSGAPLFRRSDSDRYRVFQSVPRSRLLRLAVQEMGLGALARRHGAKLLHGLHYQLPHDTHRLKCVTTVHDMTFFDSPEWHEPTKVRYFRRSITSSVERADAVVVPSQMTADRLRAHLGDIPEVVVIPHGVSYLLAGDHQLDFDGPPEILYVGTIEPRKNLITLLHAFDQVAQSHGEWRLRLLGRPGWGMGPFRSALESLRYRDRVEVVGYATEADLRNAYRRARAFVYPSFVEGFGLPVLEALATGIAVVTSADSAMAEIAGGFARLVDPRSVNDLAAAIVEAATTPRSIDVVTQQIAWARTFTWKRAASAHADLYRRLGVDRDD
ncbi:MAG: glycosyltransferase family 4 protein [Ferrimicrobium sp.]